METNSGSDETVQLQHFIERENDAEFQKCVSISVKKLAHDSGKESQNILARDVRATLCQYYLNIPFDEAQFVGFYVSSHDEDILQGLPVSMDMPLTDMLNSQRHGHVFYIGLLVEPHKRFTGSKGGPNSSQT